MTAAQKIKREILLEAIKEEDLAHLGPAEAITESTVDDRYSMLQESDDHWDYQSGFRRGQCDTGLPAPSSRHYESKSVAAKLSDGSWVGWTYWYGGGKHGEPGIMPWIEDAYDLEMTEEEKVVLVREFKIK